jgi:hypothetical protein
VVVVGVGAMCVVVVCTAGAAVAAAFCRAGLAWWCVGLWAGLAAAVPVVVVATVGVDWVVVVDVVAATLCEDVDDDDPQALTAIVSRMAAIGIRRCLMVVSLPPGKDRVAS